ncbi:serine/threonine kinase family protein, partial [Plesiocystis pacifica SIR-1]
MAGDEQHPKDAADPAAGSADAAGREAARMASTEVGARDGFRVEDSFEYDRERDAIEAALFGSALPQLKIGRFAILDRIGQGGMGTVYAAYDDQLDRKVAVKILRRRGAAKGSTQATRFMREAQAMARLRHQNTVTVHEVGEHEDGVFIAMEFVRGQSLDRWLRAGDEARPWREVVEVFRQAGRGLAAAHEAGIVHRDFKPHNAILGEDGVVQVLDFGLARAATAPGAGEGASESAIREVLGAFEPGSGSGSGSAALSNKLTVTGSILGTPAYMAPEQWRGEVVDARGDQFSFCVALYEGLYGRLPFAGDNPAELLGNVLAGRVREPPSTARVPAWVGRAVLRGLAIDPDQR